MFNGITFLLPRLRAVIGSGLANHSPPTNLPPILLLEVVTCLVPRNLFEISSAG